MGSAPTFPVVNQTEIDGIPVFWSEAPGPLIGTLMFRVGSADEETRFAGVTHLAEHLALFGLGQQEYESNGHVEDTRTVFTASGTPAEVAAFLGHVATSLADLPLSRTEIERQVLLAEHLNRGWNVGNVLRLIRYGYRTYGLASTEPLGLHWLQEDDLRTWARHWFVRQNACVWLSGAPPAGLRLALPDGGLIQPPKPEPINDLRFPTQASGGPGGMSVSFLTERSAGLSIGWRILDRTLRDRLRFGEGVIYDVDGAYTTLTRDDVEVVLGVQCGGDRLAYVRDAMLETIAILASAGPSKEEIDGQVQAFLRQAEHPMAVLGLLDSMASNHLLGRDDMWPETVYENYLSLTPDHVAAAITNARQSTILVIADDAGPTPGFNKLADWNWKTVPGREFRLHSRGFRRPKGQLIVGPTGVTVVPPDGHPSSVIYAEAAAVYHHDDQVRILYGNDGVRLQIQPIEWEHGDVMLRLIDESTPAHLLACDPHRVPLTIQ